jgi:hypothetical protein
MILKRIAAIMLLAMCSAVFAANGIPYDVDKRPMPQGTDLEKLVPLKVGDFQRAPLPKDTKFPTNMDLNMTYKAGKNSVFVGFSKSETPEDARNAVELTKQEAVGNDTILKSEEFQIAKDPGYFKHGKFFSWSRGRYFFYADASSPEALDLFMKSFPY